MGGTGTLHRTFDNRPVAVLKMRDHLVQPLEEPPQPFGERGPRLCADDAALAQRKGAIAAADEAREDYDDGVWFVDLSALAEPSRVPLAVAAAIGAREQPGVPLPRTLLERLRSLSDDISTVLLIGHNDGIWHLAEALAGHGDPDLLAELRSKYPTGALASSGRDGRRAP